MAAFSCARFTPPTCARAARFLSRAPRNRRLKKMVQFVGQNRGLSFLFARLAHLVSGTPMNGSENGTLGTPFFHLRATRARMRTRTCAHTCVGEFAKAVPSVPFSARCIGVRKRHYAAEVGICMSSRSRHSAFSRWERLGFLNLPFRRVGRAAYCRQLAVSRCGTEPRSRQDSNLHPSALPILHGPEGG